MADQGPAEAFGQHVFGQVVARGAEPAGGDEDVGPAAGDLHSGPQALRIVAHYGVVIDVDPQGGQPLGEHLRVGVGDVAEQKLGTDGDQFSGVGQNKTSRAPTPGAAAGAAVNAQRQRGISAGRIHSA